MKRYMSFAVVITSLFFGILIAHGKTSNSPIGIWESTITGQNQGLAIIVFNSDSTVIGYGMTLQSFGPFLFRGTWTFDVHGNVIGSCTEYLKGVNVCTISFVGKAIAGRSFTAKLTSNYGNFSISAIPATYHPDISGQLNAVVTQNHITISESFSTAALTQYFGEDLSWVWGYVVAGNEMGMYGPFTVTGYGLVSSKGAVIFYTESDFGNGNISSATFKGTINLKTQRGTLSGYSDAGDRISVKISR